jgi:hypothetical protein
MTTEALLPSVVSAKTFGATLAAGAAGVCKSNFISPSNGELIARYWPFTSMLCPLVAFAAGEPETGLRECDEEIVVASYINPAKLTARKKA